MPKAHRLKVISVLLLGIFFTIIIGMTILIMPIWSSKACASVDNLEKGLIYYIMQAQKGFHKGHGKFSSSLPELESYLPGFFNDLKGSSVLVPLEKWDIKIFSDSTMVDIFMLAHEKQYDKYLLHSEIARVKYDNNNRKYTQLICRSIAPGTLNPANISLNSAGELRCPLGTREDC